MRNDDPDYLAQLERALEAAELEIKGLEAELREKDTVLTEMLEQLAPTRMGEPMIADCSVTNGLAHLDKATYALQLKEAWNSGYKFGREDGPVEELTAEQAFNIMFPNQDLAPFEPCEAFACGYNSRRMR